MSARFDKPRQPTPETESISIDHVANLFSRPEMAKHLIMTHLRPDLNEKLTVYPEHSTPITVRELFYQIAAFILHNKRKQIRENNAGTRRVNQQTFVSKLSTEVLKDFLTGKNVEDADELEIIRSDLRNSRTSILDELYGKPSRTAGHIIEEDNQRGNDNNE